MNEQILQAVTATHCAVMGPGQPIEPSASVARQVAQGAAFELVAQATAFAVQDAAGFMRNVTAVAQAALAVLTEEAVHAAAKNGKFDGIEAAINSVSQITHLGVEYFKQVGEQASKIAADYPASTGSAPGEASAAGAARPQPSDAGSAVARSSGQ